MPTLLYGLTLPGDPSAAVEGIGAFPVRELAGGPLRALVSTVDRKPTPSLETVRVHDAVLQAYVNAGATVAAVRFGQVLADDRECLAEVRERGERIAAVLREYRDCVEMRVLLPVSESAAPSPAEAAGPGRAYLESLRARGQVAPHLTLRPALGALVRAERVEGFAAGRGATRGVAFAHLVARADLPAYREALRALPALARSRLVGPLPLYSFAEPTP